MNQKIRLLIVGLCLFFNQHINAQCIAGDMDSDADGICDIEDMDDDNDGIADKDETICTISLDDLNIYGNAVSSIDANNDIIYLNGGNLWQSSYSTEIFSLPIHIEAEATPLNYRMLGVLPVGSPENVNNWNDDSYKVYMHGNGRLYGKLPDAWTFYTAYTPFKQVEIDIDINGNLSIVMGGEEIYAGTAPVSDYRLAISSYNGGNLSDVIINHGGSPCTTKDIDTDGDLIPNRLDLDSDNDNCVDAFEGDANFDLNDMDGIGRLSGNIDLNAGSSSYGIPLSAGSGQAPGESLTGYSIVPDLRPCLCIASNNPADSDADGVCDAIDICSVIPDTWIGTPCDDGDDCTTGDVWRENCECEGSFNDADDDTICDVFDDCPDFNNTIDIDEDGIPYCLDNCIDVNDNDICDNVDTAPIDEPLKLYFSHQRGFYNNPFQLQILANHSDAIIKYSTTHLNIPATDAGTIYSQPIDVTIPNDGIFVVKAMAYTPTDTTVIQTHSYTFLNQVFIHNEDFSEINGNPLFGEKLRKGFTDIPSVSIFVDNDSIIDGVQDRKISIEWLYPNNLNEGPNHQVDAGIRYATGGANGAAPKRSLKIYFRSEHGYSKLKYPLFEKFKYGIEPTESFDRIYLRNGSHDSTIPGPYNWDQAGTYARQRFAQDCQLEMGNIAPHGRFVQVFLNGVYYGMFHMHERPTRGFMEEYVGGDGDQYDAIKAGLPSSGTVDQYQEMVDNSTDYNTVKNYMNVQNFIDYLLVMFHSASVDYNAIKNWRAAGPSEIDTPEGAKWHFFCWDMDTGYNWYRGNTIVSPTLFSTLGRSPGGMYDSLKNDLEFKFDFADRVQCNFYDEGPLTKEKMIPRFQKRIDEISNAAIAEHLRWTDINSYTEKWIGNVSLLQDFLELREDTLLRQMVINEMYPSILAVQFSQNGGELGLNTPITLSHANSVGTIYYTTNGEDPRLPGGAINPNAIAYNGAIALNSGAYDIIARVYDPAQTKDFDKWSAACPKRFYVDIPYGNVVINEIMYHPDSLCAATDSTELDYIELFNAGSETVNLTDCIFTDGIIFDFPYPTEIQAGNTLVLAENSIEFEATYGFAPFGQYKGGLSNDGERLELVDPFGNVIDSLTYNDKNPWDEEPDGNGPSLELLHPSLDNADPISWFRSDNACGTPGLPNSRTCANSAIPIVINEINYNSDNDGFDPGDWVELHNPNTTAVDISGWTFYDNGNAFVIPAGTSIEADDFLVIVEDETTFGSSFPHLNNDQYLGNFVFGLSNKGERVSLFDENKCLSDYLVYNDKLPWDTIPDGNGPSLSLIEPGLNNALPQSWEASSNINSAYGTPGRPNTPCPESNIVLPSSVCVGTPVNIAIDSLYPRMELNWILFGATPSSATSDSIQLVWNTPGTYNIQLVSSYFECTKIYTQQVIVENCNTQPIAIDDNFITTEEIALNDVISLNDNDPDGDGLVWNTTPVNPPANGSLTINADGTFEYLPNPGFVGNDSFEYEVCDDASYIPLFTFSKRVNSGEDDVEELASDGSINTSSGDLDLMDDSGEIFSAVGIRITNISIPKNAIITDAYLEFIADESNNQATSLTISAESIGNANPITTTPFALSNKVKTATATNWSNIPDWTAGNTYMSDDISPVVQEIISRADWKSGNAMTFIIEGTGTRTPETYDGGASVAPKLIVNYQLPQSDLDISLCDQAIVNIEVELGCIEFDLSVFLEGAFEPSVGEMTTHLNTLRGLLPGQTPLSNFAAPTPPGQPYNISPWNYSGTEGNAWDNTNYTDDMVDWVLVSTRTGVDKNTEVGKAAGILTQNGQISFPDGCALENIGLDSVYILIEHRNHMGIMTPQKIPVINKSLSWNFGTSDSYKDATSFGQKEILPGTWAMFAGDADQSDFPSFDIKGTDKTIWLDNNGIFQQYMIPDFDLNGDINGADKALWFENNGVSSRVPK